MPIDPHTWAGDFLTATLLDGDLYLVGGNSFTANGIRFHARRPIYKSYNAYASNNNNITNGNWGMPFATTGNTLASANVIVDTPGLLGAWFDPNTSGNIRLQKLAGGGGLNATPGGLMLAASYCLWPVSSNTGNVGSGIGDQTTPTATPASRGTFQALNSSHQTCTFCIDLLDSTAVRWGSFGFNGSGGTLAPIGTITADGSGWASRMHAFWASVYTANGHVVVNLPAPFAPWITSTALTSGFLNGATGLRGPLRFLNMPPLLRAEQGSTQALTANTDTTVNITASSGMDSYNGFASNTYTAPWPGLYLVHGYVGFGNTANRVKAGVNINGTTYWGPWCAGTVSGNTAATKTQIFSLNAGDTIKLRAFTTVGVSTTITQPPRLVVLYVGVKGAPSPAAIPPDTSFRWTAGQPGPVTIPFNQHIANDLSFLIQRPYLMSYQAAAQTGIAVSTPSTLVMDTITGIVHGDAGDNYTGWSGANHNYVAPRAGWYMAVTEGFLAQPTLTVTPSVLALLGVNPSGVDGWDRFQQASMVTGADGAGATAVSFYYMRAGDTLTPGIETYDSTAGTIATTVSSGVNSHFELVWLGE